MEFSTLSSVVHELSLLLQDARIVRVFESSRKDLCLLLKKGKNEFFLLVSPDRALPRLYLVRQKPVSIPDLHPFTQFLKSRMTGGTVRSVGLLNRDRIVEIRFRRQDREFALLVEVLGSAANLIITDEKSVILAVYYPAPVTGSRRPLFPGLRYELPVKKNLFPRKNPPERDGHSPRGTVEAGSAARNREIEVFYARIIDQRRLNSARSEILALTRRLYAKSERRVKALLEDQKTALMAESHKQAGNAILANIKALLPGMSKACLAGFDGEAIEVILDPGLSPADNAGRYFKKYKKAKAGREIIARRLQNASEEKVFLDRLISEIEQAADENELLVLRDILTERGYLMARRRSVKKERSAPDPYRKILHRGWEIIIGKNAAGNDLVTTRLARASDLWFHAEGIPGSHVVIKNPDEREIPFDVIEKAAGLAAFYSRGRSATKVPVTYTYACFVKKPKGAKPGMVTLSERKTIMAVPDAEQGRR